MQYEVRTKQRSVSNGTAIEADSVVAVIDTNLDADNLESMIRFGNVMIRPASGDAIVQRAPESIPQQTIQPSPDHDPDALNALDREEEAKAKAEEEAKAAAAEKEAEQKKQDLAGLAGCSTERVQEILAANGMKSKEDVRKKVEEGFDFTSLDGVGKAAATKIAAWATA